MSNDDLRQILIKAKIIRMTLAEITRNNKIDQHQMKHQAEITRMDHAR